MDLPIEVMDILKKYSRYPNSGYINPYFLSDISNLLKTYYQLSDDTVDTWIYNIFGR